MRTSHRVFTAALSTLLLGALIAIVPFVPNAQALNGVHTISIANATCLTESGNCSVTVNLSPANNVPFDEISANIATVDGSARSGQDYTGNNSIPVNFNGGAQSRTILIPILSDTIREPNETFTFKFNSVSNASAGAIGTATIVDDEVGDIPTFKITPTDATAAESVTSRNVHVHVDPVSTGNVSINYATSDGTATSDSSKGAIDYTKITTVTKTLTPAQQAAGFDIPLTIADDAIAEPDETFFLNFGSPDNAAIGTPNPVNITLLNNDGTPSDVPKLTVEAVPDKTEGDTGQTSQTVTVTLAPAAGQTVTVDYSTADGSAVKSTQDAKGDYEETKGTLTFTQGTTSRTFNVPVNGDPADETDETYKVNLSNPANAQISTASRDAKIVNDDFGQITTGPGGGGGPHVRLFGATAADLGGFMAYENTLITGIHVARGDFFKADGSIGADGIDEIVTAPGPPRGAQRAIPIVRIFAIDGTRRASFLAYDQGWNGGVYLAAGNIDGDASNGDELIVGPGAGGGPHVKVIRVAGPDNNIGLLASYFAYAPSFSGGVRVAAGNVSGDGKDEIITAPGPGGGPHIRIWVPAGNGTASEVRGFFAYGPEFAGGVFVAAANNRIATGPGAGGGPHVRVFDGTGNPQGGGFFAYEPSFTGGVSVAMGNLDNEPSAEVITGPGPGGGPHIKIFSQNGALPFGTGFFAYAPNFSGGVEVAVSTGGS